MKKVFFALLMLAAVWTTQSASAQTFEWGIAAGMNITREMNSGYSVVGSSGFGGFAGVTGKVSLPILTFGVDGSILYSHEKTSYDNFNQLVVPIHLRYDLKLPTISHILVPYIFAGPQLNYALNNHYGFKKVSWKTNVGIGALLARHLQVSYNYSLPISDSYVDYYDDSVKLATHRIGLAYYF